MTLLTTTNEPILLVGGQGPLRLMSWVPNTDPPPEPPPIIPDPIVWTYDQVIDQLKSSGRELRFQYDLLSSDNAYLGDISDSVFLGSCGNNAFADIKRTAKFNMRETDGINWLRDRIRPRVEVKMPDGVWKSFSMGVFLLSSPRRTSFHSVEREIEAYDQNLILVDDKVDSRYVVVEGSLVMDAVIDLLLGSGINVDNLVSTPCHHVMPATRDWDPGTSKLVIINNLLGMINFHTLYFDGNGHPILSEYQPPDNRPSDHTYRTDAQSMFFPGMEHELDQFAVPNRWTAVVSNPDRPELVSTYTNNSLTSPTSTVSRDRLIVDFRTDEDSVDQETLDAKVRRYAFEASQVYEYVTFETGIMPNHGHYDILEVEYPDLNLQGRFSESSWEMTLRVGEKMKHTVRRIVSV